MVQNLRIDIIYYNTPSDFEFEFNLGGCCRSRILQNKAATKKEMINSLAKAVNRSRVIIMIGELSGENGMIPLIGKAISRSLVVADNKTYHLNQDQIAEVIDGSLPLVSKNGKFCGCIVESGPQSIIMISGDKTLRNDVSDYLVFPYIAALSRTSDEENNIISKEVPVVATKQADQQTQPQTSENTEESIISDIENAEITDTSNEEPLNEEISESAEEPVSQLVTPTEPEEISIPDEVITENVINQETDESIEIFMGGDEAQESTADEQAPIIPLPDDVYVDYSDGSDINDEETPKADDNSYANQGISWDQGFNDIFSDEKDENTVADDNVEEEENIEYEKITLKKGNNLSFTLIVLCAVFLIVVALLLYYLVYLPKMDGYTVSKYFKALFSFIINRGAL